MTEGKNYSLTEKMKAFIELMRPMEWSKPLGNMVIAALIALDFKFISIQEIGLLFIGFIAIAPLLWGGLYALNDFTDWEKDKQHHRKNIRPIPSERIAPHHALAFALLLIALSYAIGAWIFLIQGNVLFLLCITAMLINQILYSMPPFNWKKMPIIDLISGSMVNPFFRFYAGWVLFIPFFNAPWEILLFVVGIQFGGYTLYRLSSKEHEKEMKYNSSVVLFPKILIQLIAYAGITLGILGFILSCLNGVLPQKFLWLAVLSFLLIPFYWQAFKDSEKMNMKKMYRLLYVHYFLFVIGFILLSLI